MMSKRILAAFAAVCVVSALALTGCGGSAASTAATSGGDVKSGAAQMQATLADLQKAVDAGDTAKAQKDGAALEEAWAKFEDTVKAQNKDMYGKIEDVLTPIEAGAKQSPLDAKTLSGQIKALNDLMGQLAK